RADGEELRPRPGRRLARPGGADRRRRGQVRGRAARGDPGGHEERGRPLAVSGGQTSREGGSVAVALKTAPRVRSDAVALRTFKSGGRPVAISGLGVHAPEQVLTNLDLEKMMETSDAWIQERTGIKRRHVAEPGTTTF